MGYGHLRTLPHNKTISYGWLNPYWGKTMEPPKKEVTEMQQGESVIHSTIQKKEVEAGEK